MPSPPSPLTWLIARLSKLIATATDSLEAAYPDGVQAWQQEVSRQLARYHGAAMLAGGETNALTPAMETAVTTDLATQLRFLGEFGIELQDGSQWQAGWNARANMYAGSIKTPYWRGAVDMLPLPAMPADGSSRCLTNCTCMWDVQRLAGDGNYDCTWVLGATDHCQICKQRGQDWAPLRVRFGVVQGG